MKTGPMGEPCEFCQVDDWTITATLIACRGCSALWGRVNGQWVFAGPETGSCPEDVCPLCYHHLKDPAHGKCLAERTSKK
jgi:hypothetical protein